MLKQSQEVIWDGVVVGGGGGGVPVAGNDAIKHSGVGKDGHDAPCMKGRSVVDEGARCKAQIGPCAAPVEFSRQKHPQNTDVVSGPRRQGNVQFHCSFARAAFEN